MGCTEGFGGEKRGEITARKIIFILKFYHQDLLPEDILGKVRFTAEPERCQGLPVFGCPYNLLEKILMR